MTIHQTPVSGRVVVGIDGSAASEAALRWAVTVSAVTGAHIEAITTWQIPLVWGWAASGWTPEKEARQLLNGTVDAVFGGNRPSDLREIVEEGNPAKVLMKHSVGAQMLVVGSRGLGGFAGLLLGSVSSACAEHASCPVLVVHDGAQSAPRNHQPS